MPPPLTSEQLHSTWVESTLEARLTGRLAVVESLLFSAASVAETSPFIET